MAARKIGALVGLSAILLNLPGTPAAAADGAEAIYTIGGTGVSGNTGDGDQVTEARIDRPRSIFPTAEGGYVFAEPWSNLVRAVRPDGTIATLAGNGVAGFSGDGGPATAASVNFVHGAAPTPDGGLLLADTLNNRIRKVSAGGVITTVAGTGTVGSSGDGGPATSARIYNPRGVVSLPDGGFLIPDTNNNRVRRVWPTGVITTVAGNGSPGFSGDGGPAAAARLSSPFGVAPTPDGGYLIVDKGNQRIRRVLPTGIITTVAGNGAAGFSGDGGPAVGASLFDPHNVVVAPDGAFLIADVLNHRVRRVAPAGTIGTIAGSGTRGYGGDGGLATAAGLNYPKAVGVNAAGAVLIADESNNRIRFVGSAVAPVSTRVPNIAGTTNVGDQLLSSAGGWTGTGPSFAYQWLRCDSAGNSCVTIAGATAKSYTLAAGDAGATVRAAVTASNAAGTAGAVSSPTGVVSGTTAQAPAPAGAPPSISGTPSTGQTLVAAEGSWTGTAPITYAYQWRRCNSVGGACADIAGATAKTYTVAAADEGGTLRVVVTASNVTASTVYSTSVAGASPTSYWRFNRTSGPLLDSRGFREGNYYGGSTGRGVPGLLVADGDTAASFNGTSQYAEVSASPAWTPPAYSLELLVEPSSLAINRTIWAAEGPYTGWWLKTGSAGDVRVYVGDGVAWRSQATSVVLQPGRRYHLVVTYDGATARLYVNGDQASTVSVAMRSNNGANAMRFGSPSEAVAQFWPGVIDDASFYPFALNGDQVALHYGASQGGAVSTSERTAVITSAH